MKFPLTVFLLTLFAGDAIAQTADPTVDPATRVFLAAPQKEDSPITATITGSVRSEMYMAEQSALRSAGGGTYVRTNLKAFPFYQVVKLKADQIGHPGLSIQFQGTGALDLGDLQLEQRFVADPSYLYVQYRHKGVNTRLGRQMVVSGVTGITHIDGLYAEYQTPLYIGLEAFGGLVVSPRQGPDWYRNPPIDAERSDYGRGFTEWDRKGDTAAGVRLFYRVTNRVSAGASYLLVTRLSEPDRQILGMDLDLSPVAWLGVGGNVGLDLMAGRVRDARAMVDLFVFENISGSLSYQHVEPSLYLSNLSVFSVFASRWVDEVAMSAAVTLHRKFVLDMGLARLFYQTVGMHENDVDGEMSGRGIEFRVDGRLRFGSNGKGDGRLGYRRLHQEDNGVDQVRMGASVPVGPEGMRMAFNGYVDVYRESVQGRRVGFIGDGGVYFGNDQYDVGGTVAAGITPFEKGEFRGMARFSYRFDVGVVR